MLFQKRLCPSVCLSMSVWNTFINHWCHASCVCALPDLFFWARRKAFSKWGFHKVWTASWADGQMRAAHFFITHVADRVKLLRYQIPLSIPSLQLVNYNTNIKNVFYYANKKKRIWKIHFRPLPSKSMIYKGVWKLLIRALGHSLFCLIASFIKITRKKKVLFVKARKQSKTSLTET